MMMLHTRALTSNEHFAWPRQVKGFETLRMPVKLPKELNPFILQLLDPSRQEASRR